MPKFKMPVAPDTEMGNDLMAHWPKRLPFTNLERILSAVALVILAFTVLFVVMRYGSLPEQIPTHFGPSGEADDYGSRAMVWPILLIDVAAVGGVLFINMFPRAINIPLALMKRPPEEIIHATRLLMCWTAIICAVLLAYLLRETVLISDSVSTVFVVILIVLLVVPMIPYYIYLMRP